MAPIVRIDEGLINGTSRKNINEEEFYAFLCIPYGKPPVGDLRFRPPQPVEPWEGVRDVTKEENFCLQENLFTRKLGGSEDCLSLHVFTKKLPSSDVGLKPVMVFIHGGGFLYGSHETHVYGPELLMTEDIVLVSITYRVGLLGFLSLEDTSLDVPGNAGLKDQVLALKWIQRNIKYFNGDPRSVTIFGESAGAASVEFLMLSPSAKNLFHKAIMQSGSALNSFARGHFDSKDFAKYMGQPNLSEKELLKIMNEMPLIELYKTQMKYLRYKKYPADLGILTPVIEKPNPTEFLTKEPIDVIRSGNYNSVPLMTGYNDGEGMIFDFFYKINAIDEFIGEEVSLEKIMPYGGSGVVDMKQIESMTEKLKRFYFSDNNPNNKVMFATDAFVTAGVLSSARNQSKISKHPVYLYKFTLETKLNFIKSSGHLDQFTGACHADELGYLFKGLAPVDNMGHEEKVGLRRMIKLWTNFSKYGNPTPAGNDLNIEWVPIQNDKLNYLDIGKELKMGVDPDVDRMKIWDEVYQCNPVTMKYHNIYP